MIYRTASTYRTVLVLVLSAALLLLASSCDTSFDAFGDSRRVYSVFGYLDANADTQKVRVELLRDSMFAGSSAEPLHARVTSENIETGETVAWEQQVERVGPDDSLVVHNFTTTADFVPDATYRFTVERESDGATSTVREVALPPAFPQPTLRGARPIVPRACGDTPRLPPVIIQLEGVEHLGAVKVQYDYLTVVCAPVEVPTVRVQTTVYPLADARRTNDASWTIPIYWSEQIPEAHNVRLLDIYSFRVTVASVSEAWPEFSEGDLPGNPTDAVRPPLGESSNVKGGTGFLGGAFVRSVEVPVRQQ